MDYKNTIIILLGFYVLALASPARAVVLHGLPIKDQTLRIPNQPSPIMLPVNQPTPGILPVNQTPADVLQAETVSDAYIVLDVSSNSIIAQKNSNQIYPIASITKLMNAVISVENIKLDKKIKLSAQMLKPEGSSPALYKNLIISARNLLQASLIQSTNDASQALTYFVGNAKFINLMNQKAKQLGMADTRFYDAHGLDPANHSTAADLAKLLTYIYQKHPEILTITKENDFWLPNVRGKSVKFMNVNNLYQDPDFLGAKAGYLVEAKQTLASMAYVNGKPVAIVLLHSTNRKTDALKIVEWLKGNL